MVEGGRGCGEGREGLLRRGGGGGGGWGWWGVGRGGKVSHLIKSKKGKGPEARKTVSRQAQGQGTIKGMQGQGTIKGMEPLRAMASWLGKGFGGTVMVREVRGGWGGWAERGGRDRVCQRPVKPGGHEPLGIGPGEGWGGWVGGWKARGAWGWGAGCGAGGKLGESGERGDGEGERSGGGSKGEESGVGGGRGRGGGWSGMVGKGKGGRGW